MSSLKFPIWCIGYTVALCTFYCWPSDARFPALHSFVIYLPVCCSVNCVCVHILFSPMWCPPSVLLLFLFRKTPADKTVFKSLQRWCFHVNMTGQLMQAYLVAIKMFSNFVQHLHGGYMIDKTLKSCIRIYI